MVILRGSRSLSLAEVGEAAGYSRGIVTHHFGSRENLLRTVIRGAQTFTLPDLRDSAVDWLAEMVRAYLKNVTSRRPSASAFLQMWGEAIAAAPVLMPLYSLTHKSKSVPAGAWRASFSMPPANPLARVRWF